MRLTNEASIEAFVRTLLYLRIMSLEKNPQITQVLKRKLQPCVKWREGVARCNRRSITHVKRPPPRETRRFGVRAGRPGLKNKHVRQRSTNGGDERSTAVTLFT